MARSDSDVAVTVMRQTWDLDASWQFEAGCRGSDANLFFAPTTTTESKDDRVLREARAKAICHECKVRTACLDFALATREPHGIWGGMNELERRHVLARKAV